MLKFYNTLTRKKDLFKPIFDKSVGFYSCGPTVYNIAHIGNLRSFVFADLLKRFLKYKDFNVLHIMNITDVDDKTIRDSRKAKIPLSKFTEKYTKLFNEDLEKLNILKPDVMPKASEHISEMVELVLKLQKKGLTYEKNGNIYFDISKISKYGELTGVEKQDLKKNADGRLNTADEYEKENVADFALWKAWDQEDGDNFWQTPLGKGRPGWHLECSAMSMKYLGESFDIHSGGIDLAFPHHTNEIAQSEGATGERFVKYWLHNEHLLVERKKMSKSKGNYFTLQDLLKKEIHPLVIRFILLKTHYRQILDFRFELLDEAKTILTTFLDLLLLLDQKKAVAKSLIDADFFIKKSEEKFTNALDNDLNISEALAVLYQFRDDVMKNMEKIGKKTAENLQKFLFQADLVLGCLAPLYNEYQGRKKKVLGSKDNIVALKNRHNARLAKDYRVADTLRKELEKRGIEIKDTKDSQIVELSEKILFPKKHVNISAETK